MYRKLKPSIRDLASIGKWNLSKITEWECARLSSTYMLYLQAFLKLGPSEATWDH